MSKSTKVRQISADTFLFLIYGVIDQFNIAQANHASLLQSVVSGKQGILIIANLFCFSSKVLKNDSTIKIIISSYNVLHIAAGLSLLQCQSIKENVRVWKCLDRVTKNFNSHSGIFRQPLKLCRIVYGKN